MQLNKKSTAAVEAAVDVLFDRVKLRVLGPRYAGARGDKRIAFGPVKFDPHRSLPGLFGAASAEERVMPDTKTMERLLRIGEGFIEAQRATTKAQVVATVGAFLQNAWAQGIDTDVTTVLGGELADVWKRTTSNLLRIVNSEATTMRNVGVMGGILKVNESLGIDDPVVFFVVVRDRFRCEECTRLHLLLDRVTPRVWKLSEVGADYHKKGDPNPKLGGLHPNCRCSMVTLLPGWGFDKDGMVKYISEDHDELKRQRGG